MTNPAVRRNCIPDILGGLAIYHGVPPRDPTPPHMYIPDEESFHYGAAPVQPTGPVITCVIC